MKRKPAILLLVVLFLGVFLWMNSLPAGTEKLAGKKILFLGDSLLAGYEVENTWCKGLRDVYGMDITMASVDGSTLSHRGDPNQYTYWGCYEPISTREIPPGDYDMVFVTGGANDWLLNVKLGTIYDTTPETYRGAIRYLVERIRESCPDAVIVFSTTWECNRNKNPYAYTLNDYNEAMARMGELYDFTVIRADDADRNGMHMMDGTFHGKYALTPTDTWHLNEAGHSFYLPVIAKILADLF